MEYVKFTAHWTDHNHHLNRSEYSLPYKVAAYACSWIFWLPNTVVKRMLIQVNNDIYDYYIRETFERLWDREYSWPAPNSSWFGCSSLISAQEKEAFYRTTWNPTRVHLKTPDNRWIDATYFQNNNETTRTVLCANPNAEIYQIGVHAKLMNILEDKGIHVNFLLFNYSSSFDSTRDLILDGETAFQFLQSRNQEQIDMYGISLGGAVMTQVKALHPESNGKLVTHDTFSSLFDTISHMFKAERFGYAINKISALVSYTLAWFVYLLNWELDTRSAWNTINAEKIALYPNSDFILGPASWKGAYENERIEHLTNHACDLERDTIEEFIEKFK